MTHGLFFDRTLMGLGKIPHAIEKRGKSVIIYLSREESI